MTAPTSKQQAFFDSLLKQKFGSPYINSRVRSMLGLTQRAARGGMTRAEMSEAIATLLTLEDY